MEKNEKRYYLTLIQSGEILTKLQKYAETNAKNNVVPDFKLVVFAYEMKYKE